MWTKWARPRVGTALPDEPRREIQVVVVEEDGRVRVLLELVGDGVSERRG